MLARLTSGAGRAARAALLAAAALAGLSGTAFAEDLIDVRVIDSPQQPWANGYELIDVADVKGFFKEAGVNLVRVALPPDQYTSAIDARLTDVAPYADYAYFINVRDKGLKVREIVASSLLIDPKIGGDGLFVPENSAVKSPEDLKGKTIGMTNLSWSSSWFTLDYLGQKGVGKEDVTYIAVPPPQQEQSLLADELQALYAFGPLDAQLKKKGGYRQLFKLSDLSGRTIIRGGTMAREDWIEENPEAVRRYVTAIAKAADWANENGAEVVKIGIERGKLDPELAPWVYTNDGKGDFSVLKWAEHGLQKKEDVAFWLDLVERQGIVPKGKHKVEDLYTDEFNPYFSKTN
ncbi:ABC transporter substrate-binding protein [Ensifer soli]|uniref:ABC transporter substrate-binding protein n=1 Tax=Ciceribacter sp. sgz301302 TaxID=3342379 RepID=UPI0035B98493